MPRQLLVVGEKTFRITIPDDAKVTFGPWSPGSKEANYGSDRTKAGTLRIYQGTKENIIACFSGVQSFRDLGMGYSEQVVVQEGASIWKDDQEGYVREEKVSKKTEWVEPQEQLTEGKSATKKARRSRK